MGHDHRNADAISQHRPRRDVLRHGVTAAGLVWVSPAIRTARLSQVAGSPPPATSTTAPQPTAYTFAGDIPLTRVDLPVEYTCSEGSTGAPIAFTTNLGSIGTGTVELEYCVAAFDEFVVDIAGGSAEISTDAGTLTAVVTGGEARRFSGGPSDWSLHIEIDITGGTGLYDGAVGSATLDGILHFGLILNPGLQVVWDLDGTFDGAFVVS